MKFSSLFQSRRIAGVMGGALLGLSGLLAIAPKAWALPPNEVLEKLAPIPVFTITDNQGAPLVAQGDNNDRVAGVFISLQDAQNFLTRLRNDKPELGNQVMITPLSLGEVFRLSQDTAQDGLNFAYVPNQGEVASARSFNAQSYGGGVPLYTVRGGSDGGYLMMVEGDQEIIPFFFEKFQVNQFAETFKASQPSLANTVTIEVVALEDVIATLVSQNNALLEKLMLIPSRESLRILQDLTNGSQGGQ